MTIIDRLLGKSTPEQAPRRRAEKAVTSLGPWGYGEPFLSSLLNTPQAKAAAYLQAYKVGWFYKAGRKISQDIASLDWSLSLGDSEQGEDETVLDRPDMAIPFESLSPIDQFQRLMEFPNPSQTGRVLMQKTQVRLDFAGAAAWYLEGGTSGLPSAIYGISPARMWPSYSKSGVLIGWVMDKDKPEGGVPFDVSEILWFSSGNAADDDLWGVSAVEAVYSQVPLTNAMARHTGNVLSTGGRLAGMMWPKDRALSEDEFTDAQRAWRNVASDPDSGKRLLIFPEPMEYAAGASTPAEIGIPELAILNRDEILTAFPISPYQLGVPTPGGLNSGEVRREDRRDYWEGTIHPRADLLEEVIQVGLLSRYEEAMGQTYDYEIAEPNLDDAATLTGKATAFKDLVGIGLDPVEALKAVGLDHIKFLGLPALIDPVQQQMAQEAALEAQANQPPPPAKAIKAEAEARRDSALDPAVDKGKRLLAEFFDGQRARVIERVKAMPAAKADRRMAVKDSPWWPSDEDDLLTDTLRVIYAEAGRGGLQTVADTLNRVVGNRMVKNVLADLLEYGGERVKDINARTLQALTGELGEGVRRGYSIPQLVEGVPAEAFKGVMGVTLDNGTPAFGELRAETIARTETMLSYNRAAVTSYGEFGVERLLAYDGDGDEECAARDGMEFTIDEAEAIEDHPNGTLTWAPVVEDKGAHEDSLMERMLDTIKAMAVPTPVYITMPDIHQPDINVTTPDVRFTAPDVKVESPIQVDVHVPEAPAPVVNVTPPDINVEAPVIKVNVPKADAPVVNIAPTEVHVAAPDVTVNVPAPKPTRKTIERDKDGRIVGLTEK